LLYPYLCDGSGEEKVFAIIEILHMLITNKNSTRRSSGDLSGVEMRSTRRANTNSFAAILIRLKSPLCRKYFAKMG